MIISHIIGGLGNQFNQYAMGRTLAFYNSTSLKLDIYDFDEYQLRNFRLNHFHIQASLANAAEIKRFRGEDGARKKYGVNLVHRLLSNHRIIYNPYLELYPHVDFIQETPFTYNPEVLQRRGDIYLRGYWSTYKYFEPIKNQLEKELTVKYKPDYKNCMMLEKIRNCESVALHIRRGDKVTIPTVGKCDDIYYNKAIDYIRSRKENVVFFIFTDDKNWVKEKFCNGSNSIVVDINNGVTDYEDYRLMRSCKHNITANSSFSWWAAWLNINKNPIITAPQDWYSRDEMKRHEEIIPNIENRFDKYPKEWALISSYSDNEE
jgi:hypothetical protein